ncbi:4Fe-4S dicluster domain-containing protein [Mitsuokella sp. oral taxon 131]|uniref:4Fe-4S dicluster domain-containing protein n=1 Tax=Mitsuokella sp. oral taxon 131 TaxID=1321780 RepID=UPI0004288FAE|nr:4Fe-4S dicluster domain-containing protein [Mitsuokella sp. oral taxon 131]
MAQEIAMLHDVARCSACRACMVACKQWHDLPADMSTPFEGQYQSHKTLTPTTWNLIQMNERVDKEGKLHWDFSKIQCMHCGDPACADGCPEDAIERQDNGCVVIHQDKCVGCGYCAINCPFGVPKINKETNKSTKCDLCYDRIAEGMEPACSKTCTADAINFGTKEEMLALAQKRLDGLKPNHPDANIYNPEGVGGVHMLYVLPEKPEVYGFFKPDAKTPASIDVWKDVVKPVGQVAAAAAVVGVLGLAAIKGMSGGKKGGE